MPRRTLAWLFFVVLMADAPAATVMEPATLNELAQDAALIVRGQVTDVRAATARDGGIESIATIAVARTIKGAADALLSIRVPGGAIAGRRQIVVGAPTLRVRQHAVFFLARDIDNVWRPIRLSAGVIPIRMDAATGREVVQPMLAPGRTAVVGPVERGDGRRRSLGVDEFEALMELVLADTPVLFKTWRRP